MEKDNRTKEIKQHYDEFSNNYDIDRTRPYFALINSLELGIVLPLAVDKVILGVGCGTGLLLKKVNKIGKNTVGVDISRKMLRYSRNRLLNVAQADILNLPFRDESFQVTYSFKTLPHISKVELALKEMTRVTRPGGFIVVEFYNPYSIKCAINKMFSPNVYQRFDSYKNIKRMLPKNVVIKSFRGIRIFTFLGIVYKIPILSSIFRFLENKFCDSALGRFGGYFVVILNKASGKQYV